MINSIANFIAVGVDGLGSSGLVRATVVRVGDDGEATLRLAGGREVTAAVEGEGVKLAPGQGVMIGLADGKIYIADTRPEPAQQFLGGKVEGDRTPGSDITALFVQTRVSSAVEKVYAAFESPLLRSLPVELFEQVLSSRDGGGGDLETLAALDRALRGRGVSVDAAAPAQLERVEQWLRLALDNPKLVAELAERVPVLGAKELAELVEMMGRISNVNVGIGGNISTGISTEVNINTVPTVNTGANLIEAFCKMSFGTAPAALLDLVRRIDSSSSAITNTQISAADAQRIVDVIVNRLPEQAPLKPERVHDAKQLSLPKPNTGITPSPPPPSHVSAVQQIRSEFSGLTEAAVRILSDGAAIKTNAAIAPLTQQIATMADLIEKIPIVDKGEISANCKNIINTLKTSVNEITALDTAGKIKILDLVRDTISSLDSALRPITREERPVPQNFYDRVVSAPERQVNTETKAAVFTQIGAVQDVIRAMVAGVAVNDAANVVTDGKTNVITNVVTDGKTNAMTNVITDGKTNAMANVVTDGKTNAMTNVITNSATNAMTNVIPNNATNTVANVITDSTTNAMTNVIPNTVANPVTNAIIAPALVLHAAERMWVNTENLRTGFQEAFSSLNLENRASPLPHPPPESSANKSMPQEVRQSVDALRTEMLVDVSRALREVFSSVDELRAAVEQMRERLPEDLRAVIEKSPEKLPEALKTVIEQLPEKLPDILRAITEKLPEKLPENLRTIIEQSPESLRTAIEQLPEKLPDKLPEKLLNDLRTLIEAEKSLSNAVTELEKHVRLGSTEIMEKLKDVLKELNRLQFELSKPLARENQSLNQAQNQGQNQNQSQSLSQSLDGLARSSSPADVIRSTALTVARGLENLSLLAAQTRGADIQQQVIALPVKMGQEWTEVQVKFIKNRQKNKKKDGAGGHVSVYLNVAPSGLGEVSAHFDYHPPSRLKLSLRCERPAATKWFRDHLAPLREALAQAGLPGASLEFHSKRPVVHKKNVDDDVQLSTHTNTVKNGKVDFKV